ncbi:MAG: hypothetical protein WCZ13_03445 [Acholeplasmataceae bacterium]
MRKISFIKKSLLAVLFLFSVSSVFVFTSHAAVMSETFLNDSFDGGMNDEKWQVVNDTTDAIGYLGDAGTLRYVDTTGAEEVMMTTNPLTSGEGVTGYSVEFDFLYQSADWGDWFGFAFNKTEIVKGLDWGKGGYLMGRISSLQINNPSDTVDGPSSVSPNALTTFEEMTPTVPSIGNVNVRFKFVYTTATKKLELYYDKVSETMDMSTLRNTFTFGSLSLEEDYHFAIVSSGKGLYELDNLKIEKLTATDPILYVEADFESAELPEEITLAVSDKFSYGPAKALDLNNPAAGAMILSKNPVVVNPNVDKKLHMAYQQNLTQLDLDKKTGVVYGVEALTDTLVTEGVVHIYFVNRDVAGTPTTFIGATMGDGEALVQVLAERSLDLNLASTGYIDVELSFGAFNNVHVNLADLKHYDFKAGATIGHFGFTGEVGTRLLVDNFTSKAYTYYDQSQAPDLAENFETDYLDSSLWEIYNAKDLRPGTEMPLFPTTKGIYIENGKLNFDVAGESARLITKHDYANVEVRFSLEDFNQPITPRNEDGEIGGVEVPQTFYVALSFGYESTLQNFWNVPTIIFQARDGGAVIYTLNMNDATVYSVDTALLLSAEENKDETFEFKVISLNGMVSIWMKRASDPITIFDGQPLLTYHDVNTKGRVALASSASGSFKLDDVSIVKMGGTFSKPEITDSVDPANLVKPVISVVNTKPVQFEQNSTDVVDLKTYFTVTDNKDSITITDQMINNGGFDLTKVGQYTVSLTVTDSDGNQSVEHVILSVYPEVVKQQSNTALVASLTSVVALGVGFGVAFVVFKKVKKI